uniref:Uncharacterized protein n=1 Tax=Tetraselmis sp. GSL018 TaxID=582737 RepID=A0A061R3J2_9CHLO
MVLQGSSPRPKLLHAALRKCPSFITSFTHARELAHPRRNPSDPLLPAPFLCALCSLCPVGIALTCVVGQLVIHLSNRGERGGAARRRCMRGLESIVLALRWMPCRAMRTPRPFFPPCGSLTPVARRHSSAHGNPLTGCSPCSSAGSHSVALPLLLPHLPLNV